MLIQVPDSKLQVLQHSSNGDISSVMVESARSASAVPVMRVLIYILSSVPMRMQYYMNHARSTHILHTDNKSCRIARL